MKTDTTPSESQWKNMSMTTEYFERTKAVQAQYGPQTILLMQAGSFYEMYGHKTPNETLCKGSLIDEFGRICNMAISAKSYTYQNETVYMAGFRDYSLEKYLNKMVEAKFTVVVINQGSEAQSTGAKKMERYVEGVYSPGTHVSFDVQTHETWNQHLMCVWVHQLRQSYHMGIAILNLYTGQSHLLEHTTTMASASSSSLVHFDEWDKCLSIYRPRELVYIYDETKPSTQSLLSQMVFLQQMNIPIHEYSTSRPFVKHATEQVYRQHILSQYFGHDALVQCAEWSYNELATQSFCVLMHFLEEHNPNLCKRIQLPSWKNETTQVQLANHTLLQLNILDKDNAGHLSSVHAWTNKCITVMGKRLFLETLTHPTYDETYLTREYEAIDHILQTPTAFLDPYRKMLQAIYDIPALNRQLLAQRMYPSGLYRLYKSVYAAHDILSQCDTTLRTYMGISCWTETDASLRRILSFLDDRLHLERCASMNHKVTTASQTQQLYDEPLFKPGFYPALDQLYAKYQTHQAQLHTIRLYWERQMSPTSNVGDYVKLCTTEKSYTTLQMTKTRCTALKQRMESQSTGTIILDNDVSFSWKDVTFHASNKTNMEIHFPLCDAICKSMGESQTELLSLTYDCFSELLREVERDHLEILDECTQYISRLDFLLTKSYLAYKYDYCRPVVQSEAPKAFVHADGLRHILIEQLNTQEVYVTNDVHMGGVNANGETEMNGMLLFGTNTVGKTSMMRALGICLIMAQAGMYVPCTRFVYKPYHSIFSRILNQDNLFKGLSTFAVEMSELRVILQYADANSLILGDELCSGTETVSALSIMMSSLIHLNARESTFLFATHFHEIVEFPELQSLPRVQCYHLVITYNAEKGELQFDRKLRPGSGPRSYGLEICESLYMDKTFLEKAYEIRRMHFPEYEGSLSQPKSKYNAQKIKGKCEHCGGISEEIHHIEPQAAADARGFVQDGVHKNHVANLMALCEKCHLKMHHDVDPQTATTAATEISPLTEDDQTPTLMQPPKRRIVKRKIKTEK